MAIIGTYLLNRGTRQALHDHLVGSYVVEAKGLGLPVPRLSTRWVGMVGLGWVGLVAAGTAVTVAMGSGQTSDPFPPVLMERIAAIPGASSMEIKSLTTRMAGQSSKVVVAVLWFHGPAADMKRAAGDVAAAMLQHHPEAATVPTLAVTVIRGWDVGLANKVSTANYAQSPEQWRAALGSR